MEAVYDLLAQRAALTPDRVAMEELETGRVRTFAQLEDGARRAAGALAALGVGEGDRVAILCRNRIAFFEALFGCAKLGAVLVPLNWRMPAAELAPLMADASPRLILCGVEDEVAGRAIAGEARFVPLDDPGADGWEARLAAATPFAGRARWPLSACWYLLYTSGTTGAPKGVIQTYGMALANYVNVRQAVDLRDGEATLNFLPLFHTAGINLHTLPVLFAGGRSAIMPGFDAGRVLAEIEAGRLDLLFAVPAVYQQLALHPRFAEADLAKVRHWGCGGAPLPDVLVQTFAARGVTVCNGMGMTETGPTVFLAPVAGALDKIGSVGKPQILSAVRIVDPDGRDVAPGEAGELLFAGPNVTPGYWNRPDATRAAFVDGWLRSGDLARMDADGWYWIVGRAKEMYISGGENVYPAEVENVLAEHPAILEAAVVGVPDERWGEVGCAYLLLRPDAAAPEEADLTAFVRARLAAYKAPKRWVIVPEFPRTAAGKVQKHKLKADVP